MRSVLVAALGFLGTGGLLAQAPPLVRTPRFSANSFIMARYRVGATASLFAAGRVGRGMLVAGVITNPTTDYEALVVGAGTRVRLGDNARSGLILAGASATDGTSLRLYATPALTLGDVTLNAITAGFYPLSGTNPAQFSADPVTLSLPVIGGLRAGVTGIVTATDRRLPDYGVGPYAQLRLPLGSISMELVARTRRVGPELRGMFNAAL